MTFLWPTMLLSLASAPLVVAVYLLMQRKRRKIVARIQRISDMGQNMKREPGFRRHIPPLLFLMGLMFLMVAAARPQAEVKLPRVEGTVILVMDVSGSMAAADITPDRLDAAKATARDFIQNQPETIQIGIVSFSSSGFTVQSPTHDKQSLIAVLDRLQPQSGTSLGQGILVALNTIAVNAGLKPVNPTASSTNENGQSLPSDASLLDQLPDGPYPSSLILILSDGEDNMSFDPTQAAQAAADRDVRIDALGFGTTAGFDLDVDGFLVHTVLDETTLQLITQTAGGSYHNVQAEEDLKQIYKNLTPDWVIRAEKMEITSIITAVSVVMLLLGGVFSLAWFNRLP
jgi:Ca-activated chloride channel family protein